VGRTSCSTYDGPRGEAIGSIRIAVHDNEMLLLSIGAKPMSKPPFPLEFMEAGG
jgi:hypothetical protein